MENSRSIFLLADLNRMQKLPSPQKEFLVRDIWNERAHKQGFSPYTLIHWRFLEDIESLLQRPNPRAEISCAGNTSAYLARCQYIGGVGVTVSGTITLAGESDLGTTVTRRGASWVKVTSAYDRLMSGHEVIPPYEVTLADWSPRGIVVDCQVLEQCLLRQGKILQEGLDRLVRLSNMAKLPLVVGSVYA